MSNDFQQRVHGPFNRVRVNLDLILKSHHEILTEYEGRYIKGAMSELDAIHVDIANRLYEKEVNEGNRTFDEDPG